MTHAWMFASEDARTAVDARTQFVEFLRSIGTGDELVDKAELVFGELLGNVVRHASGPEFPLTARHLPDDVLSELGRGLFIVQQLATDVRVERIPNRGNHTIVKL
jgi:anti-sigma regulatory factor (Ser/Thr protein kinase)